MCPFAFEFVGCKLQRSRENSRIWVQKSQVGWGRVAATEWQGNQSKNLACIKILNMILVLLKLHVKWSAIIKLGIGCGATYQRCRPWVSLCHSGAQLSCALQSFEVTGVGLWDGDILLSKTNPKYYCLWSCIMGGKWHACSFDSTSCGKTWEKIGRVFYSIYIYMVRSICLLFGWSLRCILSTTSSQSTM